MKLWRAVVRLASGEAAMFEIDADSWEQAREIVHQGLYPYWKTILMDTQPIGEVEC